MNTIEKHILRIESDITEIEFKTARIKRALMAIKVEIEKSKMPQSEDFFPAELPILNDDTPF